jgi:hypothetical protein
MSHQQQKIWNHEGLDCCSRITGRYRGTKYRLYYTAHFPLRLTVDRRCKSVACGFGGGQISFPYRPDTDELAARLDGWVPVVGGHEISVAEMEEGIQYTKEISKKHLVPGQYGRRGKQDLLVTDQ